MEKKDAKTTMASFLPNHQFQIYFPRHLLKDQADLPIFYCLFSGFINFEVLVYRFHKHAQIHHPDDQVHHQPHQVPFSKCKNVFR